MNKQFRNILLCVCIVIFLLSMAYIMQNKYAEHREKQLIEEIQEVKYSEEIAPKKQNEKNEEERTTQETNGKYLEVLPEYKKLYEQNNDLVGWLQIKDIINYPVMYKPEDPNFYLYRNWNKEYSKSGSIYIDGRCSETSNNLIIYGHKMRDGSQFGSLEKYKEKEFYESHRYIRLDTIYAKATYEVIAVAKAVVYYDYMPQDEYLFYEHVELNTQKEFENYIEHMKENSYYEIDSDAVYGDKLITLCTCDYWKENARLLIVAKKIS